MKYSISRLYKKNHIYSIIEYDDGLDTQKIVLDFEKGANYAQSTIYKKMLDSRNTSEPQYRNTPEPQESKRSPF